MLSALAQGPSEETPAGPEPLSASPSPVPEAETESDGEAAALPELANAFKLSSDPAEAAAILIEFLETAGFARKSSD